MMTFANETVSQLLFNLIIAKDYKSLALIMDTLYYDFIESNDQNANSLWSKAFTFMSPSDRSDMLMYSEHSKSYRRIAEKKGLELHNFIDA